MNLDLIWSREPTTVYKSMINLNNIITICELVGVISSLSPPGPYPFEDNWGWMVAFAMLVKSLRPGHHSESYMQYATIQKLRSSTINLFNASYLGAAEGTTSSGPGLSIINATKSPTNSLWFCRWSQGCKAQMGFITKQNKAVSIEVISALHVVASFVNGVHDAQSDPTELLTLTPGLAYSVCCLLWVTPGG